MPQAHHLAGDEARAEIADAFRQLRPSMIANAERDADLDPNSRLGDFSEQDLEQFLNAYEAMFMEALEGTGRATRDLILETALPPIIEFGQTSLDMVRSNVISAVMMTYRMLPLISDEHREEAARWLAAFHSGYSYELIERAQAVEAERR